MAWHIVEKFLEQVAEHSTLVGKFWVTFFFVLRFLMVVSIADNVFEDEQEEFTCNTLTPGCENVCFNDFSPISLIRLWALQILCVALPTIIFITYAAHKLAKVAQAKKLKKEKQEKKQKLKEEEERRLRALEYKDKLPPEYSRRPESDEVTLANEGAQKEDKKEKKDDKKDDEEKFIATAMDVDTPSSLMLAYIAQILFRLLADVGFLIFQLNTYVYKFWIPELFKCSRFPCPNAVDCFVSRPKEKTIILWIMFASSIFMIILNLFEIWDLGFMKIFEAWQTRDKDITKKYKLKNNMPTFHHMAGGRYGGRYLRGYPQAVGIRVGYARSSISGAGNDFDGDEFI